MEKTCTKKISGLVLFLLLSCCINSYAQLYNYTNATNGAPSGVASNATASNLLRVNGATVPASPCATGFSSTHFTNTTVYSTLLPSVEWAITPNASYKLNVTSLSAALRRSSTGPASVRFAYSTDGGATWIDQGSNQAPKNAGCGSTITGSWDMADFSNTTSVKFRISGFNASASAGTLQLLNVVVSGTVTIADNDGDGYAADVDCNDNNAAINPGATEICNNVDDNCNGLIDDGLPEIFYGDQDGDGYGNPDDTIMSCSAPSNYVLNSDDCDDAQTSVHPGATEICNGVDDNCDGQIDEGVQTVFYADDDLDGFGNFNATTLACTAPFGYVSNSSDCNDGDAAINPAALDMCNLIDDNCNGQVDENAITATITPSGTITECKQVKVTLTANIGVGISYQWYKSNVAIAGATSSTYKTKQGGSFTAHESNAFNCSSISAVTKIKRINCKNSGEQIAAENRSLALYPNPSDGNFTLQLLVPDTNTEIAQVEIFNSTGQRIYSNKASLVDGAMLLEIHLGKSSLPGLYFVRAIIGHDVLQQQVQVQR